MKRFPVIIFMLIMALGNDGFGQSSNESYIKDKSKAVLFGIDNDLYIESFLGTAFSGKWHHDKNTAVRMGVSITCDLSNRETDSRSQVISDQNFTKNESYDYSISTTIEYLKYLPSESRVLFFWGIGPQITYRRSDSRLFYRNYEDFPWKITNDTNIKKWNLGIHTTIGIECFIAKNVSLMAEYGLSMFYGYSKSWSRYSTSLTSNKEYNLKILADSKKLGVSFYLK